MRTIRVLFLLSLIVFTANCGRRNASAEAPRAAGEPTGSELDALVSGAGQVHIGTTQAEAIDALGQPTQRHDAASPGDSDDLLWDLQRGAHPGKVMARFIDKKLVYMEIAPAAPSLPTVSRAAAESLETGEVVQRAVAGQLPLSEVESVAGQRGALVLCTIGRGKETDPDAIVVRRTWAWRMDTGANEALFVTEEGGRATQPITRPLSSTG